MLYEQRTEPMELEPYTCEYEILEQHEDKISKDKLLQYLGYLAINTYKDRKIEIKQAKNHHVIVLKDGEMVMHIQADHLLTDMEKKEVIDFYYMISEQEENKHE